MAVCTHGSNPNPSYRRTFLKKKEIGKVTNGAQWESRVGPLADAGKLAYETGMAGGLS